MKIPQSVKNRVKRLFTRRARASLYASAIALDVSLVTSGDLPAWTLPIAPVLLLALLNLNPTDVEDSDPAPSQD